MCGFVITSCFVISGLCNILFKPVFGQWDWERLENTCTVFVSSLCECLFGLCVLWSWCSGPAYIVESQTALSAGVLANVEVT